MIGAAERDATAPGTDALPRVRRFILAGTRILSVAAWAMVATLAALQFARIAIPDRWFFLVVVNAYTWWVYLPAYPAGLEGFTGLVLASQPEPLSIRIDSINVDVGVAGNDLGKAAHQAIAGVEFQTISGLALGGIVDRAVTLVDGAAQPVSQTNGGLAELLLDVQFALGAPDHTP